MLMFCAIVSDVPKTAPFVAANVLDQKARERMNGQHDRRQHALAPLERLDGQQEQAQQDGVDHAVDLRRVDAQAAGIRACEPSFSPACPATLIAIDLPAP